MRPALFSIVLFLVSLTAQAKYEDLANKTFAERVPMLKGLYDHTLRFSDSVSIFKELELIRQVAKKNDDGDLLLEVGLMEAHYYFYRCPKYPTRMVLKMLADLSSQGVEQKKPWLVGRAENMMALYCDMVHEYESACEHYQKMYDVISNLSPADFPHKQYSIYHFGIFYHKFAEYRMALRYLYEAYRTPPRDPETDVSDFATNTMGLCYQEMGQYDSSDYWFRVSLKIVSQCNKPEWKAIIGGNLGHNYMVRGQFDKAVPLLEKDVQFAESREDWPLASGSLMDLAAISLERNDLASAGALLQKARVYAYNSEQYKRLQTLYPLLSRYYSLSGQPKLAIMFLDSSLYARDSVARAFNGMQLLRAQQQVQKEQQRSELQQLLTEKKIKLLQRNLLVGLIILLLALSIYIYRRQQKKNELNTLRLQKAEAELRSNTEQLEGFTRYIHEKNTVIESLQQKIGGEDTAALQELQKVTILTDAEWDYFQRLFEKVHAGYLVRLKQKLPGLTPAEVRYIVLSKLRLSNKEMAATLGVGPGTIRQHRSRIRKKLNINEEDNMEAIIDSI